MTPEQKLNDIITKAIVLVSKKSCDQVLLETVFGSQFSVEALPSQPNMSMRIDCPSLCGYDYVVNVLKIDLQKIETIGLQFPAAKEPLLQSGVRGFESHQANYNKDYIMSVKFYQVGGCIRDEIMGLKSKDIDFSVEAESYEAMRQGILDLGCRIFVENPEYLTIRAKHPNLGGVDYVLCRKDGEYSDGRRPDEVIPGSLHDDLARRDFTMNAIAKTEEGVYIDPFCGIEDINNGIIRCVGKASDRFNEDALRMLRAIRFAVTKSMKIDVQIAIFLTSSSFVDKLDFVSVERIYDEMTKMFEYNTLDALKILDEFPLIREKVFSKMKLLPSLKKAQRKVALVASGRICPYGGTEDTLDLESSAVRREGANPSRGTYFKL